MIDGLCSAVARWARARSDVMALALVGSHARGSAKPTSDVDFVIIAAHPQRYLDDTCWTATFGVAAGQALEDWGKVQSLRVWYAGGPEVEFGFTTSEWVAYPMDAGTRRVIAEGIKILFDREAWLASAIRRSLPHALDGQE